MSKVTFRHRGGREQVMHEKFAKVLRELGRGTYEEQKPVVCVVELPAISSEDEARQAAAKIAESVAGTTSNADGDAVKKRGRKPKAQE